MVDMKSEVHVNTLLGMFDTTRLRAGIIPLSLVHIKAK